jgi:beta-lactamase class A
MGIFVQNCLPPLLILFFGRATAVPQVDSLRSEVERIVVQADGRIGVAIFGPEGRDTLTFSGDERFPMQSVYKFPLALAVLDQVDKGRFSLGQKIHVAKSDLLPETWSPMRQKYPSGDVDITLDELLNSTVAQSDNNGCDILFRLIGGTDVVNRYVHSLGISNIAIVATEEEMHKDWEVQFRNWSTPHAMGQLLCKFSHDSILSEKSRNYTWNLMAKAGTGSRRLKGQLPDGTVVAHKSGSSGTNDKGIAAATNDAGIIVLPDGRQIIVVVFVSHSTAKEESRDEIIARIAREAWDTFSRP